MKVMENTNHWRDIVVGDGRCTWRRCERRHRRRHIPGCRWSWVFEEDYNDVLALVQPGTAPLVSTRQLGHDDALPGGGTGRNGSKTIVRLGIVGAKLSNGC